MQFKYRNLIIYYRNRNIMRNIDVIINYKVYREFYFIAIKYKIITMNYIYYTILHTKNINFLYGFLSDILV